MRLCQFDYDLPAELIAQEPIADRTAARLMRLDRNSGAVEHRTVAQLPSILRPGDLLVLNNTAVVPAKLHLRRPTGGRVEGLFLREEGPGRWLILLESKGRLKVGEALTAENHEEVTLTLDRRAERGQWEVLVQLAPSPVSVAKSNVPGLAPFGRQPQAGAIRRQPQASPQGPSVSSTLDLLHRIGSPPLPPYIRRRPDSAMDGQRYQTVFAREPGAVAAPTAGLHFSDELLGRLSAAGIEHTFVTLHVGLGTFEPVREEPIELHRMHSEWFDCPAQTAASVNAARSAGRRIVAVGTTSVRVLESCRECDEASGGRSNPRGRIVPRAGWTDLFIFPGYRFGAIDALLTNFHLPRSSLLMLTAAFAAPPGSPMSGLDRLLAAYRRAIEQRYRFYSYGDAMLIA